MRYSGRGGQPTWTAVLVVGVAFFLSISPVLAGEAEDELAFASALIEMGFPGFAEKVLDTALQKWPDQGENAKLIRAELLMVKRKFDEAEALVREIPPTSEDGKAIRLALANYYYAANEVDKARSLYDSFFKQYKKPPTDEKVLRFYTEASFVLSQMLENAEQYEEAAENLERVLQTDLDPERRRSLQAKQASLYIRAAEKAGGKKKGPFLSKARATAEDIQFGGPYWVARSQVLMADAARAEGKADAALKILEEAEGLVKQVDTSLKEAGARDGSPKAGYHYVRGLIFEASTMRKAQDAMGKGEDVRAQARKSLGKPMNEFGRILKYYGGSDYATDATLRLRGLEDQVIELGGQIKRLTKIESAGPKNADELFKQGDLFFTKGDNDAAIDEYVRVLNQFPETKASYRVLSNLGRAYSRIDDPLMAKAVMSYVGERFAGNEDAGKSCLIMASTFRKEDKPDLSTFAYRVFTEHFPDHEKAPLVLYTVAMSEKKKNPEEANRLLTRIAENYPKSKYYLKSLNALGWDLYSVEKYEEALQHFTAYAAAAPEGLDKANAMMLEADCQLRLKKFADAFKLYRAATTALDPDAANNPYYVQAEDAAKLKKLHMQATFQQAYCLSQIEAPEDKRARFLAASMGTYEDFVETFGSSELVPKALAGKGAVQLQLNRMDEATATFERLAAEYPDSPEGKNSLFTLVSAAVEVGKLQVAQNAVDKMAANPGNYQSDMFALVGQLMLDNELYDQAINAYQILLETSEDSDLKERALYGLGSSFHVKGDCTKAIENLAGLLEQNDRTAFFFETNMKLAQAYRECGRYDEAIDALGEIFRLDKDSNRIRMANFELALIQEEQGRKQDAFASYLRLGLSPEPTRIPALEPTIRESVYRCANLAMELADYETAIMMADKFIQVWKDDPRVPEVRKLRGDAAVEQSKTMPAEPVDLSLEPTGAE